MADEIKPEVPKVEETPSAGDVKPQEVKKPEVDYKGELEKAKTQLEQAGHNIQKLKKDNKDLEDKKPDTEEIANIVREAVSEGVSSIRSEMQEDKIIAKVNAVCPNPDEAELTLFHLKNSVKSSGNLETDISNARAMANKNRLNSENAELKRALNKDVGEGEGEPGSPQQPKPTSPKINQDEKRIIGQSIASGKVVEKDGELVSTAKQKYFEKRGKPVPQVKAN